MEFEGDFVMQEVKKRQQIPPFGSWNFCDEIPITQYFESAAIFFGGGEGEDLFKVVKPTKLHHDYHNKKGKKGGVRREEGRRKAKGVDEDLYKVPPELLYQMPKRTSVLVPKKKKLLWNFWTGCLGLNCICLKEL